MAERWMFDETMALINIWKNEVIKGEFDGTCRDNLVYKEISRRLKNAGFNRDANQCRRKIKLLRGDYRKAKARNKSDSVKDWYHFRFFKAIDEIFNSQSSPELEVLQMETSNTPFKFPKGNGGTGVLPIYTSHEDSPQNVSAAGSPEIEMTVGVNEDTFIDEDGHAVEIKVEPDDIAADDVAPVHGILSGSTPNFLIDSGFSENDENLSSSPCASTNTMRTATSSVDSSLELLLRGQEKLQKNVEGIERALIRIADSLDLIVQKLM